MSTETVIVGCKLPHGIILELGYILGKGGEVTRGPKYQSFVIKGTNEGRQFKGEKATAGEWALTPNVPKDFWDEWLKKNGELGYVKADLIFAMPEAKSAATVVREREALTTKLEPLDPKGDPRVKIKDVKPYSQAN